MDGLKMNGIELKTIFLDSAHLNGEYDPTLHCTVDTPIRFGLYSDKFAKFMVELAAEFGQNNGNQLPSDAIHYSNDFGRSVSQTFIQLFKQKRGFFDIVPGGYYINQETTDHGRHKIFKNQFGEVCMTKATFTSLSSCNDQEKLRHYFSRYISNLIRYSTNTDYDGKKFPDQFLHTSFSLRDANLIACLLDSITNKRTLEREYSKKEIAEMVGQKIEIDSQTAMDEEAVIDKVNKECSKEVDKLAKEAAEMIEILVNKLYRDRQVVIDKFKAKAQALKAALPHATIDFACPDNELYNHIQDITNHLTIR